MLDDDLIVPAERIGPFKVGELGEPQIALLNSVIQDEEERGGVKVITTKDVSLFIEHHILTQVGVHGSHPAKTNDGIRLHMKLGDLSENLHLDVYDEVLVMEGTVGLCFDVDVDLTPIATSVRESLDPVELSRDATIEWIGVFVADDVSDSTVPVKLV